MNAHQTLSVMQRSEGQAHVVLARIDGRMRLQRLHQRGSAKAILPHAGEIPEIVFLNTSGGLTGGDRLDWQLDLGDETRAVATSQTAERAYRSASGRAEVDIRLSVGRGGWLDWLPQETILFQGSALSRRTVVDLAPGAGCLICESVVLGRAAMGETVTDLSFRDWREIRREGAPVLIEPLGLDAPDLGVGALGVRDPGVRDPGARNPGAGRAGLDGARAFASLAMVADNVDDALGPLRDVLNEPGVEAGASAFDGKLTCRMRAQDGWPLRRQIIRALAFLRRGPAPRNWQSLERQA